MEHSSLPTTSFSSLNNINTKYNTDYISIPILNHKQIILDWINTINEPTCLLVSSISDLKNGNVFIEILKHYLHITNHNELMYDLLSQDITKLNPVQKVKITIDFFIKINQNNNYTEQLFRFKQLAHNVYSNEELLIDFLYLLKNIYENINNDDTVLNTDNSELDLNMKKYISSNNYFNYMNQVKTISTVNDNISMCSNEQEQECISYIEDNHNHITPTVIKDKQMSFDVGNENTFHCLSSLHQQYMTNKCVSLHKPTRNVKCNLNLKQNISMPKPQQHQYLSKTKINKTTYINSTYNNSINISRTPSTQITPKKIKLNKKHFDSLSNINNIHRKTNSNANTSFTSATNDISFSISNNTPKYNNNNNKPLYTKPQKTIINMTRGMIHIHNKLFTLEYNSLKLNHLQFIKPSEPIISINYNNIRKYKIISNPTKNSSTNNNITPPLNNNNTNQQPLQPTTTTTVPLKRNIPSSSSSKSLTPIPKSLHQSFNNTDIPDDNCGVSSPVKVKIYKWLVNIGIIKNNIIPINEIPTICINGVLLCDLINRCEGKNETIKGITRKTKTKSHIQVNINKVLEYLRSKEKFNSHHLWNCNEIAIGNKKVIWELLEDIMNFY